MSQSLKAYIVGLVAACAFALVATSLAIPVDEAIRLGVFEDAQVDVLAGLAFWIAVTLLASAPPAGDAAGVNHQHVNGPPRGRHDSGRANRGWMGSPSRNHRPSRTETRDPLVRNARQPRWIGASCPLPAGCVANALTAATAAPVVDFLATAGAATVFLVLNVVIAAATLSMRTGQSLVGVVRGDTPTFVGTFVALVPLAWLVAEVYVMPGVGWWAVLLVVLPVYVIRLAMDRLVAMREMFTQTVASLAQAVDARDHFTSGHSRRVQEISVEIGNVLRVSDSELQVIEWGGLLHDIGKIGVRDAVLLKADRLTKEERAQMNAHPVIGANIIAPVKGLAPELPIIRHHHEWYNGSGYPDRLIGEEIPKLARILHVADAFEAMTAARPYRMTPLTTEQAIAELRRFAGDPVRPGDGGRLRPDEVRSGARAPRARDAAGAVSPADAWPCLRGAGCTPDDRPGRRARRPPRRAGAVATPAPGSSPLDAS